MASKVQERIYVEAFLANLDEPHVIVEERESPDFLIAVGDEQFGLEVAQVFRDQAEVANLGSPAKTVESRRNKFIRQTAKDYYLADGLPMHVKVLLSGALSIEKAGLVDQIKLARPSTPWVCTKIKIDEAIFYLTALPHEAGQYTRWVCIDNSVAWRGKIGPADILPLIKGKATRLAHYRSAIRRVELLLVVDTTQASGIVRWDPTEAFPPLHGFAAIYLYFHPGKLLRLN